MKVKVKTSPVKLSARVANRASGMNEVLHDETLIGNGNNEPLGVNPDIIPDVSGLLSVIPATANPDNPLADQGFVNSSIQTSTAHFRGNWDTWADVPSDPESYPVDAHGNHAPTPNDYLVVVADEQGGTWRYKYTGVWSEQGKDGWKAEYQVNETPLTAAQLAALNSGVTAESVADIANKQDKLVAGDGITIDGNRISASGGGDYLPLSGGTMTGAINYADEFETLSEKDILTYTITNPDAFVNKTLSFAWKLTQDQTLAFVPSKPNTGGFKIGAITFTPRYDGGYELGSGYYRIGTIYAKWLSSTKGSAIGNKLTIPDKVGTLATIEDIEATVGDISSVLDAINGEAI